ncbi:MAG: hypothetical protein R3Y33_01445 [Clostridia bacterium]
MYAVGISLLEQEAPTSKLLRRWWEYVTLLNVVIGVVVNTIGEITENDKIEKIEETSDAKTLEMYNEYRKLKEQMKTFEKAFENMTDEK